MQAVNASLHDPTDFSGLPVCNGKSVTYVPPEWAHRVAAHDGVSLVFLDEVNTAAPATQNALMRVIQEHRVGYLHLGERVRFVAAANPAGQNGGAWELSVPLANRFAHLQWPLRPSEWLDGYLQGWPKLMALDIGDNSPCPSSIRRQRQLQATFLARYPRLLCDPPEPQTSIRGWPSPRSWTRLAYSTALAEAAGASGTTCALIAAALVGEAAAVEFLADVDSADPPDSDALLDDPAPSLGASPSLP